MEAWCDDVVPEKNADNVPVRNSPRSRRSANSRPRRRTSLSLGALGSERRGGVGSGAGVESGLGAGGVETGAAGFSPETAPVTAGGIEAEPAVTPAAPPIWFAGGLLLALAAVDLPTLAVAGAAEVGFCCVLPPADPVLLADKPAGGLPVPEGAVEALPAPTLVAPALPSRSFPAGAAAPIPTPAAPAPSPAPTTSEPFPGAEGSVSEVFDQGRQTATTATNKTTIEPATNKLGRFCGT